MQSMRHSSRPLPDFMGGTVCTVMVLAEPDPGERKEGEGGKMERERGRESNRLATVVLKHARGTMRAIFHDTLVLLT